MGIATVNGARVTLDPTTLPITIGSVGANGSGDAVGATQVADRQRSFISRAGDGGVDAGADASVDAASDARAD